VRPGRLYQHAFRVVIATLLSSLMVACGSTSVTQISSPSDARCQTSLTANPQSVGHDGGSVAVSVTTTRDCSWTSTSEAPWIRLSTSSGQGEASFTANVESNPQAASRSGTVDVNGQRATITQTGRPCTFDLTSTSTQFDSPGGSGRLSVATLVGCSWRATTTAAWIQIASTVMTGAGEITYEVSPNDGPARDAAIVVADKQITVAQAAQAGPTPPPLPNCTPTVVPLTIDAPHTASVQTVQISIGAACAWSATSGAPWLTITSPAAGAGSAALTVSAAANPGGARVGTLTVAGLAVTVRQAAVPCTFTVNPTSQSFGAPGGGGRFTVTTPGSCSWSASKSVPWIDIVQGTGTGAGDVTFTVQANTVTFPRAGTITVGGQPFTVNQSAGPCTYSLAPATLAVPAGGGRQRLTVTTSSNCSWTAAAAGAPFVVLANQSQSGTGSADINFDVVENTTTAPRTATITVEGQTTTITQAGVACTYALNPAADTVLGSGATSRFTVTTQPMCSWTAIAAAPWVTISAPANGSGTGSGEVTYTVQPNADSAPRVTTITVGGQTYTVTQNGAAPPPCSYALNPASAQGPAAGGPGTFTVTTQAGCAWTAATSDTWITVNTGSGTGTGNVSYAVQANATGASRTGTITAGGQPFTLTQAP
jgi:hypothetical protein